LKRLKRWLPFRLSPRLALTVGGRYNVAKIDLVDHIEDHYSHEEVVVVRHTKCCTIITTATLLF
jgi:hypothetical protein